VKRSGTGTMGTLWDRTRLDEEEGGQGRKELPDNEKKEAGESRRVLRNEITRVDRVRQSPSGGHAHRKSPRTLGPT